MSIRTAGRPRAVAVGLAAALVAGLFAYHVGRWAFLGDDGYISFRYAQNLVDGHGLVWNPGERVEGYTNFLWVLLVAAGLAVGLDPEVVAPALGIGAGAALVALVAREGARRHGWTDPLVWMAPLALATSRTFTAWCTGGLETSLFALLAFAALAAYLRERETRPRWPLASSLLLALATLTRPDGAVFAFVVGLFFLGDVAGRRRRFGEAVRWALPCLLLVGAHLVWRRLYYGFWVPNTFHVKVSGLWWEQAARWLTLFHEDYAFFWFVPLLLLPLLLRRDHAAGLLTVSAALYLGYLVYVGGDRFEFRLLVPLLAPAYLLVADGLRLTTRLDPKYGHALAWAGALALVLATARGSGRPEASRRRDGVASIEEIGRYAARRAAQGRRLRALVEQGVLPPDLLLCTGGAGALPYFVGWPTVDYHGLSDLTVARLPVRRRGLVGHEKTAPAEYLRARGVEVFDVSGRGLLHRRVDPAFRRPLRRGDWEGRLRIVEVGRHEYLVFATFLSEAEFRARFGHLRILQ